VRGQLQEGGDAIVMQQKLSRLADSSECGWGAVDVTEGGDALRRKRGKKQSESERKVLEKWRRFKGTYSERDPHPPQTQRQHTVSFAR